VIQRYALYAALAALAIVGALYFLARLEVAGLKLQAEQERVAAATDHANKLQSQSDEHAKQISAERSRAVVAERDRGKLLDEVRRTKDANAILADSVRLAYNRVRQRAADQFGDVSADTAGSAGSAAGSSKEALNHDLAEQLSILGEWCEAGWNRVRAISAVQASCLR
jgi:hypothetical protein